MIPSPAKWFANGIFAWSLLIASPVAYPAYSCFITQADSLGAVYPSTNTSVDTTGNVTLTCSRDPATDSSTLAYTINIDSGQNYSASYRQAKEQTSNTFLKYTLRKSTSAGTSATCGITDSWSSTAPISGTLSFTGAAASVTWGYCLRTRRCGNATGNCNKRLPPAGLYTDLSLVSATYASTTTHAAPINYSVGVTTYCEITNFNSVLSFNYTAFSPTAVVATNSFSLTCNPGTSVTLSLMDASTANIPAATPTRPTATAVLQGLQYTLGLGPNKTPSYAVTTTTNTALSIDLTGTMPAGQAGTCSSPTGVCTSSQQHLLSVTY